MDYALNGELHALVTWLATPGHFAREKEAQICERAADKIHTVCVNDQGIIWTSELVDGKWKQTENLQSGWQEKRDQPPGISNVSMDDVLKAIGAIVLIIGGPCLVGWGFAVFVKWLQAHTTPRGRKIALRTFRIVTLVLFLAGIVAASVSGGANAALGVTLGVGFYGSWIWVPLLKEWQASGGSKGVKAGMLAWRKNRAFRLIRAEMEQALANRDEYWREELERQLANGPTAPLPASRLKALIMLAHPDHHGGSKLSLETTQWLLSLRQKARAA